MLNLAAFKNPVFSLYVAGCWLVLSGLYTVSALLSPTAP